MELAINDEGSCPMIGLSRVCCCCLGNAPCARQFEVNARRQVTQPGQIEKRNAWNSAWSCLIQRFFVAKWGQARALSLANWRISFARSEPVPILRKYRFRSVSMATLQAFRRRTNAVKLTLAMVRPRKWEGTLIPVVRFPFLIGQEPGCHLRVKSSEVRARHCALLIREDRIFVSELAGATFVNEQRVQGQQEVHDRDCVHVAGLMFSIRLESNSVRSESESVVRPSTEAAEDAAAALLLAGEEGESEEGTAAVSSVANRLSPGEAHGNKQSKSFPRINPRQPEVLDTAAAAGELLRRFKQPFGLGIGDRKGSAHQHLS
jgi:FHA domain